LTSSTGTVVVGVSVVVVVGGGSVVVVVVETEGGRVVVGLGGRVDGVVEGASVVAGAVLVVDGTAVAASAGSMIVLVGGVVGSEESSGSESEANATTSPAAWSTDAGCGDTRSPTLPTAALETPMATPVSTTQPMMMEIRFTREVSPKPGSIALTSG
jgi:hypothetical protein